MSTAHEIQAYEYVNRPYEAVGAVLRLDPLGIFQRATVSASVRAEALATTLRANVGPVEFGADAVVEVTSVEEGPHAPLGPRTRLGLTWHASKRPELFPTMMATLDVYALGPEETQVDFHGSYRPPLGVVGAAVDALVGHRIAQATVHRFVKEITERLRVDAA
jgi:hypothetical protein